MEDLAMNALATHFRDKAVLITGHTGFKGGWLATWLKHLGARVTGFALPVASQPSLFEIARVADGMTSIMGDIRDPAALSAAFTAHQPEIVFHLAAQSLVRRSYAAPLDTYATNVMGTVHLLEAVRRTPSVRAVVVVTSDKCYENREWVYAYRENDAMGGYDPYSSSKAAAELVTSSYRNSFFSAGRGNRPVGVASARAGNVIGGGDWAEDRLVPDCVRALAAGRTISIRNPDAVRPWQHVLESLSGYLWLASRLWHEPAGHAAAWNFGPQLQSNTTVRALVDQVIAEFGAGAWIELDELATDAPHEAGILRLDCAKAAHVLEWTPVWSIAEAVQHTVAWYRGHYTERGFDAHQFTLTQIEAYTRAARVADVGWARAEASASVAGKTGNGRTTRAPAQTQAGGQSVAAPTAARGPQPVATRRSEG